GGLAGDDRGVRGALRPGPAPGLPALRRALRAHLPRASRLTESREQRAENREQSRTQPAPNYPPLLVPSFLFSALCSLFFHTASGLHNLLLDHFREEVPSCSPRDGACSACSASRSAWMPAG